jgi:small subunit ribosomal protein S1
VTDQERPEMAVAAAPLSENEQAPATAEAITAPLAQTSESPEEVPAQAQDQPSGQQDDQADETQASTPRPRRRRSPRPRGDYAPVEVIPPKKIVKTLAVGMELEGRVKRLADFGAFIDIGVGRDGLVHVSEVSVKRVAKISDVLNVGDTVQVWIKELDRTKNRISLTMISPETRTIHDLNEGDLVTGTVTRLAPYGAFIDIGVERDGMLHVKEMASGYVAKPEDVVKVGDVVEIRVSRLDKRRGRIDLSMKGLRPEPELEAPEPQPQQYESEEQEPEAEEDVSIIEIALQKAQFDKRRDRRERRKQRDRDDTRRTELDDIISRTLRQHRGED